MLLCAICNALREDVLPRRFMQIPQAAALRLLLQEKKAAPVRFPADREGALPRTAAVRPERSSRRNARTNQAVDVHLLHGAGTTALVSSHGAAHVWQEGVQLSRFFHALRSRSEGMYVHLEDAAAGEATVFGMSGRAEFDAGSALFREELRGVHAELRLFISPETGALCQKITLENRSAGDRILAVTGCFSVALAKAGDMRAHPVFQNLFVETRRAGNALFFHRRAREAGGELKDMVYLCSRRAAAETSLEKLVGRRGMTGIPGGIARELSETTGHVLNPCAALRTLVPVKAGGSEELHFVLAADKDCAALLSRIADADAVERALLLSAAHARAAMRQAGVDAPLGRLLQRACVCLFDAKLRPRRQGNVPDEPVQREALWSMGISGENPILLMELGSAGQLACARELLHAHSFFRSQGVMIDLVFLNGEGGYSRPARDALEHMIAASPLSELRAQHGGVFVLDKNLLEEAALSALLRAAALRFDPEDGFSAQLRRQLDALDCPAQAPWQSMEAVRQEQPENLAFFNSYGGFDGDAYVICLRDGVLPPAPWANIIASEGGGAVITARGGGFAWHKNSRSGRLTPFANDALREGWGWMFYLLDEGRRSWMRLLPGDVPMTDFIVRFSPGLCRWQGAASGLRFSVEVWPARDGVEFSVEIENTGDRAAQWRFAAAVDWLLGVDNLDASLLHSWSGFGACFASGAAGTGLFAADDPRAGSGCELPVLLGRGDLMHPDGFDLLDSGHGGSVLHLPVRLAPGKKKCIRLLLCGAEDASSAHARLRSFQREPAARPQERILRVQTPDAAVNHLFNGFLQAQTKYARILGRTGLYQPGGAYGFRDQLQDMLPLIYTEPGRVRDHLLRCAARQFAGGDVLHWWHEPCTGVRTKIRDDLLFLPYVAAQYVLITGDEDLLREELPYLRDVEIPEGREDVYARMQPSDFSESLHSHCMRAFRRAAETGSHGLCLMGGGDWNDGMNRIGIEGRGESIWLTEFLAACAADYAQVAPNQEDRAWLCALNERLCGAVEQHGWDGGWYLRAYADDGSVQGGKESSCCRIDAISQAWAVLAGLDERRCAAAMDAAWKQLADENYGLIRLLTPPYDGRGFDPGYIAAYPPGVRENGAQYTHGACWLALALVRMGDAERAHRAIEMLLPLNHARTKEQADLYRVEPYVMAADICTSDAHMGRGGWTWYTGSAAWMLMLLYALLGLEKRGNRVRLNALLGDWEQAAITLPFGSAAYTLICRRDAASVSLDGAPVQDDYIEMQDDGRQHSAVFPPRCAREGEAQRRQKITRLTNKEIHRVL